MCLHVCWAFQSTQLVTLFVNLTNSQHSAHTDGAFSWCLLPKPFVPHRIIKQLLWCLSTTGTWDLIRSNVLHVVRSRRRLNAAWGARSGYKAVQCWIRQQVFRAGVPLWCCDVLLMCVTHTGSAFSDTDHLRVGTLLAMIILLSG